MILKQKITCIPENDSYKRFLLGQRGKKELLAIGLNPSTANETKLDPTSRNIKTIAINNNYDGWRLTNLYPLRTSRPNNLPKKSDLTLGKENITFIKNILLDTSYNIKTVLFCWGNNICNHKYLIEYSEDLILTIDKLNITYKCLGITKKGHPFHPAPMGVNRFLGGINKVILKPYKIKP